MRKKKENHHNALIDVKLNKNSDVKILKKGAKFIPGVTSIPKSGELIFVTHVGYRLQGSS